ncbi:MULTISPECIES: glycosyltransferase family 2 protein [unclassified Xanthobacter]|uniref:glycosyltransferase family 2 protein n=1 Tax=unclassified Xanthobacter TaxID=2623496 RepID=UPI001EDD3E2E|nr:MULTISPECIES: glycosyltransferase [unclassified Xanthobacter]
MADDIPPLALRRAGRTADGQRFRLPLLLRLTSLARPAIVVMTLRGATMPLRGHFEGATHAPVRLEPDALNLVEVPAGARGLVLVEAGTAQPGFYPIRGQFPLGRLLLKLQAFLRGRLDPRKGATGKGATGLAARWRTAADAARHLGLLLAAKLASSPLQRALDQASYQAYRDRFVEDFTTVPAAADAPPLVFISLAGARDDVAACARALRAQTDSAFLWLLAVPADRPDAERAALNDLVAGIGRLVPFQGDPVAGLRAALADATSDDALVCLLDPVGHPTRDAVALVRDAFASCPDCQLLYTDEERLDPEGRPLEGVFKPAFNRHLLEAWPYFGALTVLRLARLRDTGLRAAFGDAVIYDALLRYLDGVDGAAIRHLPRIAYARPDTAPGFADATSAAAAAEALVDHLGVPVETTADGRFLAPRFPVPEPAPKVSIVIPTRDRADLMGMTLRTLIANTRYRNFEIIIVDNGSVEPETFALFREIEALWPATRVVRDDGDFNYPRICNAGVAVMTGDLLLLLNNDIEVIDGGWLDEMVALISRSDHGVDTGVVGAKLLYPDRTIQHGGVVVGLFGYASHWFAHCPPETAGLEGRLLVRQNLSAVTGACLLIRKAVWDEIGPLDAERFAEDCNDIDLCMRARAAGHGVIFTPFALMIHHESASRGSSRTAEHRARLKAQQARFDAIWHAGQRVDPHYNPNLSRRNLFAALAERPDGPRSARTDAVR